KRYEDDWEDYAAKESAPTVRPVLVVQVEDASGDKLTRTDIDACVQVVEEVLGPLNNAGIAHAFQEGMPIVLGDERRLRYVAPVDIQDDQNIRVVFFKRSLTTGWDCPRAEAM